MPQFRVVVPPNVREGQVVRAVVGGIYPANHKGSSASGPPHPPVTVNVRVPKGATPGDAFIFELSQERVDEMLRGASTGGSQQKSSSKQGKALGSSSSTSPTATGALATEPAITDTRLVSYTDSFSDMFLGFLIGMSMVFGFFAGVLYVTDPL